MNHMKDKLKLNKTTVKKLGVRTAVKAGIGGIVVGGSPIPPIPPINPTG